MKTSPDSALLSLLLPGKAGVRSSFFLATMLQVPQRAIGFTVNRLRKAGHLIGSIHGEGYYLIETQDELEETIAHIEHRKVGIDHTISCLRENYNARAPLEFLR